MSVAVWRVIAGKYTEPPHNPFDGKGARLNGGRWNAPGVAVVYTSGSLSLAVLEVLVHSKGLSYLLDKFVYRVEVPDDLIADPDVPSLPEGWHAPQPSAEVRAVGDRWVASGRSPVLRVPSAVITVEFNYLLNPRHPQFPRLRICDRQPLPIDPRLLGK